MVSRLTLCIIFLICISRSSASFAQPTDTIVAGEISVVFQAPNRFEIELPSSASFRDFALTTPGRVVIDIRGASLNNPTITRSFVDSPVRVLRIGEHDNFVRIVLETNVDTKPTYSITPQPNKLFVELGAPSSTRASDDDQNVEPKAVNVEPAITVEPAYTPAPTKSRLSWSRNLVGLIMRNSGDTTLILDQCAVCTSSCTDLPALELPSGAEQGVEAAAEARISCIVKDSSRSERLLITPQDGMSGNL